MHMGMHHKLRRLRSTIAWGSIICCFLFFQKKVYERLFKFENRSRLSPRSVQRTLTDSEKIITKPNIMTHARSSVTTLIQTSVPRFRAEAKALPRTFGVCDALVKCNTTYLRLNVPRIIDKDTKLEVEPEYHRDFWGQVDFHPVPLFHINTHDPTQQDVYISASVHRRLEPWDQYIWNLFVRILSNFTRDAVVVDVGANLGYFSLLAASMGYKVVALEPMTRNAAKFVASIAKNQFEDKVILYQNAAWHHSCAAVTMSATHDTNQGNGQITAMDFSKVGLYGRDFVDTIRLDDVIQGDVLLMKIDTEGSESAVLDGAKSLICWNIVRFITLELSHATRQSKECSAIQMLQLFQSLGYAISDITADAPSLVLDESMQHFPPNILLRLEDPSVAPGKRMGPNSACVRSF